MCMRTMTSAHRELDELLISAIEIYPRLYNINKLISPCSPL